MKHAYQADCTCQRCMKERARRSAQAAADPRRVQQVRKRRRTRKPAAEHRSVWGSAEWAETYSDDIPSLDEPGDDFDMPKPDDY